MRDWQAAGDVFSFLRRGEGEAVFCAFNLGPDPATQTLPAGRWTQIGAEIGSIAPLGGTVELPGWGLCLARKE